MSRTTNRNIEPCVQRLSCRLMDHFKTSSKQFWVSQYCEGERQPDCARLRMSEVGRTVPDRLLPNGDMLE